MASKVLPKTLGPRKRASSEPPERDKLRLEDVESSVVKILQALTRVKGTPPFTGPCPALTPSSFLPLYFY